MNKFSVTYYDGKTSRAQQATVVVYENYWQLLLGEGKEIRWEVNQIIPSKTQTKQLVSFSYGVYPFQYIECTDKRLLIAIKNKNSTTNLYNGFNETLHKFPVKSIVLIILLILSISMAMYLYVLPNTAEKFAENVHKSYVKEFGSYVFNIVKNDLEIDSKKSALLQEFANELQFNSEFPIQVYVATSSEINAFALSGGRIVVYTGLLNKLKTPEQLAALLSHEVTHVKERHVIKNLSRNLSSYLFLSILFGDVNGVMSVLMENGHMLTSMNYSRALEQEADKKGVAMLYKNNINPEGMVELFKILKESSNSSQPHFKYISSHPLLDNRIAYVEEIIKANKTHTVYNQELKEPFEVLKNE